jgi:hypothetical protein
VSERRYVKHDKYALGQIGREYGLTAPQRFVLDTLVRHAHFQTHTYTGTSTDLADDTGLDRSRTVPAALDALWEKGLVVTLKPLGPGTRGELLVTVYDRLVAPERTAPAWTPEEIENAQNCANPRPSERCKTAQRSRSDRVPVAQNYANAPPATSNDATPGEREAVRKGRDLPRDNCEVPGCDALGEWENDHGGLVCEAHGRSQSADVLHERGAAMFAARFDAEIVGEVERG